MIPGSGRGDKIPVLAEPGEHMQPKSAVDKYGVNFFEALRKGLVPVESIRAVMSGVKYHTGGIIGRMKSQPQIQKMREGGTVAKSSDFSGQLHTINLNVNNKSHTVYGNQGTLDSLVKTLRRSQLVTA